MESAKSGVFVVRRRTPSGSVFCARHTCTWSTSSTKASTTHSHPAPRSPPRADRPGFTKRRGVEDLKIPRVGTDSGGGLLGDQVSSSGTQRSPETILRPFLDFLNLN